jgi:YidC/Oxa1 family membrane protein insertase
MMDNVRLFLWLGLLAMLWLNYNAWVHDYQPAPSPPAEQAAPTGAPTPTPGGSQQALPALNEAAPAESAPTPSTKAPSIELQAPIHVRTDVLDVIIDSRGGDIVHVDLPQYPVAKHQPNNPVQLLDYEPDDFWVFQTGYRGVDEEAEPNHLAQYRSKSQSYQLAPDQDDLVVELDWVHAGQVAAKKIYTFHRGEYQVDLQLELVNRSSQPWKGAAYAQMDRLYRPVKRHFASVESYSFNGPVLYNGEKYSKLKFDDLVEQPVTQTVTDGWMAGIEHHFLAAIIPPSDQPFQYRASTRGQDYVLTTVSEVQDVAPGKTLDYPMRLFVGPKLQKQLAATADGLELTVDYGVLTVLAQPLFWILSKVHGVVGNWGWSIVIVTMLIKLAFYKLTQTSGRSMAKMRKLAPRMKALQERYKEDRQALSQAMMELYKREKVNPAAGCLPMIIQMPFFFAFYWVLIESVELRQAPFLLWIDDISSRDPYFVLPLFMGAAMLIQSRLNPSPPDPVQAKVMRIMPLVFTVFFAFFPSGLVLYWLTNTSLSILQQWRINKLIAAEK